MLISWMTPTWVSSAPRQPRLSLAEPMPSYFYNNIDGYPGTYAFGYDVLDAATGNTQYRNEERYPNGTVVGSYGYLDSAGRAHRYRYVADEKGYRVMKDRPNPYTAPIVNPNAIVNTDEDTVTWKRKKPHRATAKPEIRRNNVISFPGQYFI
ncbi:cuticle protein 16.8-like [Cydia splendana]|uniref:cuticle protein 16.8-like n=1 Tax=Cydia splendana TaxID=1100963 RepID=UPI00300CE7E8